MKKSLLFGAAALMAFAANAQTLTGLTKVWEHSMADYTATQTRSIGCIGKKALVPNHETGALEVWGANGKEDEYKVTEWCANNGVKANESDEATLTLGRGVSTDEAGNIIVNLGFPNMPSSKNFVAIKPDGTMLHIKCEYPADVVLPDASSVGRCDFLGDKTAGDVTGNAFIVVCPNQLQDAIVYNVYEGEQDPSYSYKVKIGDPDNVETWATESTAIPLATVDADATQAPMFITHHRSIAGFRLSEDGKSSLQKIIYGEGENASVLGFGSATCSNFSAFTVNEISYVISNQPSPVDGSRTHYWEVKRVSDGVTVASWDQPADEVVTAGSSSGYMVGFASSVNEDGTVNIFQFNMGIRLAMYKFDPTAGVEGAIADDVNAPVKYYNLQGVEIANPENGLFIKKQGAKATKVVL